MDYGYASAVPSMALDGTKLIQAFPVFGIQSYACCASCSVVELLEANVVISTTNVVLIQPLVIVVVIFISIKADLGAIIRIMAATSLVSNNSYATVVVIRINTMAMVNSVNILASIGINITSIMVIIENGLLVSSTATIAFIVAITNVTFQTKVVIAVEIVSEKLDPVLP